MTPAHDPGLIAEVAHGKTMDVRLPSGQIIRGVPEGTTQAELRAKLLRNGIFVEPYFDPERAPPLGDNARVSMAQIRQKFPMYEDISDGELVRGVHRKFYSDIPYAEFLKRIDFAGQAPDPTEGMSGLQRFNAGVGKSFVDTGRGLKQIGAQVADAVAPRQPSVADLVAERDVSRSAELQREVDEARELDAPLMGTGAGLAGFAAGGIAQMVAPGAAIARGAKALNSARLANVGREIVAPKTYLGSAAQGAALAGAQPVATGESRAANMAAGGLTGVAAQGVTRTIGAAARPRTIGLNDQQKLVLREAEKLGYRALPSQRTGSGSLRVVEAGLSRTIGGAGSFAQVAKHNQTLTNQIAARELGRESDTVTRELLNDVSSELGKKYDALRSVKAIRFDPGMRQTLSRLLREQSERPEVLQDPAVVKLANALMQSRRMTGSAFVATTKALRKQSRDAFRSGNSELGHAKREIAEALEQHAKPKGASPSVLADFKDARHKYSKLLTIEDAVNERGDVSAAMLARLLRRQSPKTYLGLSSDLEKAAAFEKLFPPLQSSGTVEGAQALVSGGAMLADPTLGMTTLAGPFVASRLYTTRAGGALAEAPVRLFQGLAKLPQRLNPATPRQRALAEALRRAAVVSGTALPQSAGANE